MRSEASDQHRLMATLAKSAADKYGDDIAARFLRDGEWQSLTFADLGSQVSEIAISHWSPVS